MGRSGSLPCVHDQTQYVIIEKRLINKVVENVRMINVLEKGLKKISTIKLIMITPIFISKD